VDRTSCQWRALPVDFPPWDTVYYYFRTWNRDGTLTRMPGFDVIRRAWRSCGAELAGRRAARGRESRKCLETRFSGLARAGLGISRML